MKISTPIWDFVSAYSKSGTSRFHMPGHKGIATKLGVETIDITEISGADYLFEAQGIIKESEDNASNIFGTARTLYSTEGSSLSIKTMVALAIMGRKNQTLRGEIIAPRNVHKAFVNGCALADADVIWVFPEKKSRSICTSSFTANEIESAIKKSKNPCGVYITSPDYLGNIPNISAISRLCKSYNIPLLVDNAHGAYLKFLEKHPIDLGADICCDSAHKTLPVITGGGYLHISKNASKFFSENAKQVMSMYASTSPSFITLQSLDLCNEILANDFSSMVGEACKKVENLKTEIGRLGIETHTYEPMKLTISPNPFGYTGDEIADILRNNRVECEYSDDQNTVLMCSPYNKDEDFNRTLEALKMLKRKEKKESDQLFCFSDPENKMSIRESVFSPYESVDVENALKRICGLTVTSCQPSVPIVVSGEVISDESINIFKRYSIFKVNVVK